MDTLLSTSVAETSQASEIVWPDFPVALKEAVGVRLGNRLFAGLGTAGAAWFALDVTAKTKVWQPRAEFPFPARNGAAAAAAADGKIYVFGGAGRSTSEPCLHQFDSIACYDPVNDFWTELSVPLPVGMLGASAGSVGSSIYLFGGYNKPQLDQFFQDYEGASQEQQPSILHAYMDRMAGDFAWNDHIWEFNTLDHSWRDLGQVPHAPNCGSGIIVDGSEILLASGEIKPGLRSISVKHASIQNGDVIWRAERNLPTLDRPQEGIAASFSGKCGKVRMLAGGTNFEGARQHYDSGKKYAHQGLHKLWRDEIYVLRNELWELAGRLPYGRATGLTFEIEDGLLLVGGDTQNGESSLPTWLLSYNESSGITIHSNKLR